MTLDEIMKTLITIYVALIIGIKLSKECLFKPSIINI